MTSSRTARTPSSLHARNPARAYPRSLPLISAAAPVTRQGDADHSFDERSRALVPIRGALAYVMIGDRFPRAYLPSVDAIMHREDLRAFRFKYESGRNVSAYRYFASERESFRTTPDRTG